MTAQETQHPRTVRAVFASHQGTEGAGFPITRPFPTRTLPMVDPFLLLDEMGPYEFGPGQGVGAPDHPHRGFETVTYMLEGRFEHRDSAGNHGILGPGDVQWMTAGAGVVHSETPEKDFNAAGGRLHGLQLWVNLPADQKMIEPRYQDTPGSAIPVVDLPDGAGTVKVIAGEAEGEGAVIDTRTPIQYLHFTLQPGKRHTQAVPAGHNGFVYTLSGRGAAAGTDVPPQHLGILTDGDRLELAAGDEPWSVLLITGRPLDEPVARWGPFVMNTEAQVQQALDDFRAGRLGRIQAPERHRVLVVAKEDELDALVAGLHAAGHDVQGTSDPASAERRIRAGVEAVVLADHPHRRRLSMLATSTGSHVLDAPDADDAAGADLDARLRALWG